MEIKVVRLGIRLYATLNIRRVRKVSGVNNRIDFQTYFLIWDFDNTPLSIVVESLRQVQDMFMLPEIDIWTTGKPDGYHAYCFKACNFVEARGIIGFTPNVDNHFFLAGVGRGYWTLRYSTHNGREIKYLTTLQGYGDADIDYSDACSFVEYTKAGG